MELHCTKDERGIRPGIRTVYVYDEPNADGERMVVELGSGYVNSRWLKSDKTVNLPAGCERWITCSVGYEDAEGNKWNGAKRDYNPSVKPATEYNGYTTEFDWVLEDTEANREAMLREIERRFYGTETTREERAA